MPYRDRYQTRQQIVDDIEADRGDCVDEVQDECADYMAEELMQAFGFRWESHDDIYRHEHRLVGQWESKPGSPPGDDEEGL